ncbi:YD repeat-containing protein [Chitinophaga sp. 180180018-2]
MPAGQILLVYSMVMKHILYFLLIVTAIASCRSNRSHADTLRLTTITIRGEDIPQYSFQYDLKGNLVELVRHDKANDTNVSSFTYDSSQRITGMVVTARNEDTNHIKESARVTGWDENGNITTVQYFDAARRPLRSARIHWKNGLPATMKFSDSTQAISWNYETGYPNRKDICIDPAAPGDTLVTLRTARYEWDDSINPLRPLLNQLLLSHAVSGTTQLSPLGDLAGAFLHVSNNNPYLIKITEKERLMCRRRLQDYERYTTLQYDYSYDPSNRKYPTGAWVHLHCEGYTGLGADTQFALEYRYE